MLKLAGTPALIAVAMLSASGTGTVAQPCTESVGEGTAANKVTALHQAYEAILKTTDENLWRAWVARSRTIGSAPGYKVSKLRSKCSSGGTGQICRMTATLCKD